MTKKKILFWGSPDNAREVLEILYKHENIEIVGIVSVEDAKVGRKQILTPSKVSAFALEYQIPLFRPEKAGDENFIGAIKKLDIDFSFIVAYGKLIPQAVIDIPKGGTFNLHYSLLPRLRGASPLQSAILNADEKIGFTFFKLVEALDAGDIAIQKEIEWNGEYIEKILSNLSQQGAQAMIDFSLSPETYPCIPQNEEEVTLCTKFTKADGEFFPNQVTIDDLYRKVRAFSLWPGTFFFNSSLQKKIKVLRVEKTFFSFFVRVGEFLWKEKMLFLGLKDGIVEVQELQVEGKKAMSAKDFASGYLSS